MAGNAILPVNKCNGCIHIKHIDITYIIAVTESKDSSGLVEGDTFLNLNHVVIKCH